MSSRLNLFIAAVALMWLSDTVESCDTVIDFTVLLDSSQSICATDPNYKKGDITCKPWAAILDFVNNIVSNMTIGVGQTRVAIARCYTKGQRVWNLTRGVDSSTLRSSIKGLNYSAGSSNMSGALDVVRALIYSPYYSDDPTIINVMVTITNGRYTDPSSVPASAGALQQDGVIMYAIGDQTTPETDLQMISSPPKQRNQNYFVVDSFENLMQAYDLVMQQLCQYSC